METYEIRYFLAAAEEQNIHKASKQLNITPSAISKAISRLEQELEVKLFERVGRNIRLTSSGYDLKERGSEFLGLEKKIKESYNKEKKDIVVRLAGPEILLSHWGPLLFKKILKSYPEVQLYYKTISNELALDAVQSFASDLALTYTAPLGHSKKMYKKLMDVELKTFASKKHPLAKIKKSIPIATVLEHQFLVTDNFLFSNSVSKHSRDGWRDDQFKRSRILNLTSLKCLDSIIKEGLALSYLPEYYGKDLGLVPLEIEGCPFTCKQSIYLLRNKYSLDALWALT